MRFRVLAGALVAAALQLVFLWSFLGALHAPRPQGLPFGVVTPSADEVANGLEAERQGSVPRTSPSRPSSGCLPESYLEERHPFRPKLGADYHEMERSPP